MPVVRRFWIEFERGHETAVWWIGSYAGVTGYDERDCLAMVADLLTDGAELPRCAASRRTSWWTRTYR